MGSSDSYPAIVENTTTSRASESPCMATIRYDGKPLSGSHEINSPRTTHTLVDIPRAGAMISAARLCAIARKHRVHSVRHAIFMLRRQHRGPGSRHPPGRFQLRSGRAP